MLNLLITILLFSFFLSDVVSVGPNLYPLRIVAPIILIYGTTLLFHKSIVKKVTFKIPEATCLTLCFFIYMALSTFGIFEIPFIADLMYKPVPPTIIGILLLLKITSSFFSTNSSQSITVKF